MADHHCVPADACRGLMTVKNFYHTRYIGKGGDFHAREECECAISLACHKNGYRLNRGIDGLLGQRSVCI